ncbi:putative HTH-type transcriptional regulator YybR [Oxobacter pfennigii]|uniref:Putative HTH-type transcriptional regulator YybR n=1 Tax=Oxobacter pfennigii TaxID=36849 RepID=A0A0P9AIR9_9CLOT|nr:helix-turn-helix domain-containing protein [Oxobacter pfennigii]KPU45354.1 putative HTH-type transcriptional regulator YybR [Oxobacter pfennigii]
MIIEEKSYCENSCANKCPCKEYCPLGSALKLIGGKWKIPILCALHQDGTTRYNELKRKINGITNTMLASSLKELENDGLVCRRQYDEMPVRVEYALTSACDDLIPILNQLAKWGSKVNSGEGSK